MKSKFKDIYEAPSSLIVEFKSEGMICQSPQEALQNYIWHDILEE